MNSNYSLVRKLIAALFVAYPQISLADGFTGADVLNWTEQQQNNYFQTSVTMIGIVATQVEGREQIAECIDGWYWKGEAADPANNAFIRDAISRYPDLYPQAVILAVVEKNCGKF